MNHFDSRYVANSNSNALSLMVPRVLNLFIIMCYAVVKLLKADYDFRRLGRLLTVKDV